MKVNAAYVAGTVALILLGASHLAFANEPFLPRSERSFARLDADSDGKMTVNEWKPKAEKRFLRLDDDKTARSRRPRSMPGSSAASTGARNAC